MNNIFKNVKKSWKKILQKYINNDILNLYKNKNTFPKINNIFETFKYFELEETKLVFLGQDPYINYKIIRLNLIRKFMHLKNKKFFNFTIFQFNNFVKIKL